MSLSKGTITTMMIMAAALQEAYTHTAKMLNTAIEPSEKEPSESAKRAMIAVQEKRIRKNQKRLAQNGGMK